MTIETLKRLKANPFYKMSAEQQKQLDDAERKPMQRLNEQTTERETTYQTPELHDDRPVKQTTQRVVVRRSTGKKHLQSQ